MTVKIYTAPGCQRCKLTADRLTGAGIEVNMIDVSEDEALRDSAIQLVDGLRELPIVDAGAVKWSGFKPDRINEVIRAFEGG